MGIIKPFGNLSKNDNKKCYECDNNAVYQCYKCRRPLCEVHTIKPGMINFFSIKICSKCFYEKGKT